MKECLVNMLYFMNSGDEELVRQSSMSEASDVGYWMSLHDHHDDGNSDDPMLKKNLKKIMVHQTLIGPQTAPIKGWTMRDDYRRRVVRRLNRCEDLSNFEGAARLITCSTSRRLTVPWCAIFACGIE